MIIMMVCLQCTVLAVHPGGISVSLAPRVRGFVPNLHLAEVLLKNPEKKFSAGKKLKCKVAGAIRVGFFGVGFATRISGCGCFEIFPPLGFVFQCVIVIARSPECAVWLV